MKCPACGFEQPQSNECQKCGIVFEKFFKRQQERRMRRQEEEESLNRDKEERALGREPKELEAEERKEIFRSVSKRKIPVSILTPQNRIEGNIYITKNFRLSDMLNSLEVIFIAVTEAKIFTNPSGELIQETDFVSINKNHIILITEEAL